MKISFELAAAVVGMVSGLSSLVIQLSDYLRNKPKIKVEIEPDFPSRFIPTNQFPKIANEQYRFSCFTAFVNLKITNKSASSVTIDKIVVSSKERELFCFDDILEDTVVVTEEEGIFTTNSMYKKSELFTDQHRIDCYDVYKCCVDFVDFGEDKFEKYFLPITVTIYTASKKYKIKTNLSKLK